MNDEFDFSFADISDSLADDPSDSLSENQYEEESDDYGDSYITADMYGCQLDSVMPAGIEKELENLNRVNSFNDAFPAPKTNNVIYESDVKFSAELDEEIQKQELEKQEKVKTIYVAVKEFIVKVIREGVSDLEKTSSDKGTVREYKKTAEMPKISYAKPIKKRSFLSKLVLFLFACAGVGVFIGGQANSYYIFKGGKVESAMACAWSWLMEENLPFALSPLYPDVFGAGFLMGFGLLGIIGLFIWLDSDAKKQSRVGHEHGNAHLGNGRDFKIYKNKFMEK